MTANDVWDAADNLLIEKFIELAKTNLVEAIKAWGELESVNQLARGVFGRNSWRNSWQVEAAGFDLKQLSFESWGDGNEMESVVEVLLHGDSLGFLRFTGTYSSWDVSEWYLDQTIQVVPRTIRQTVYLNIDGSEDAPGNFIVD